jgi:hypothetical protein
MMNRKLIAILCAVILLVSLLFVDLDGDLDGDLAGGSDAATALTNEVMAVMAAAPTLSVDEAKDIASQNLVTALVATGSSPSEAAATAAGATESVVCSEAFVSAPAATAFSALAVSVGLLPAVTGCQNAAIGSSLSRPAGGEPGSGQEDETEDNSYAKPA